MGMEVINGIPQNGQFLCIIGRWGFIVSQSPILKLSLDGTFSDTQATLHTGKLISFPGSKEQSTDQMLY